MLRELRRHAEAARRQSSLQELLLLESRSAFALGDKTAAAAALLEALHVARKSGRMRACADSRTTVVALADSLGLEKGADPAMATFLQDLRRHSRTQRQHEDIPSGSSATSAGEALSARELVVLQLVARGMRNKQAAAQLNISEHTVRWHVRNVLEKLNVTNRMAAVNAARELGLLAS
jgi:LuxR family maltose regulon positive regulatory protein